MASGVNSLAPGWLMNDSVATAMAGRPGLHDFVLSTRAIKKDVFADELVGTLIYLASPDSDAVTGQFLIVDMAATIPSTVETIAPLDGFAAARG